MAINEQYPWADSPTFMDPIKWSDNSYGGSVPSTITQPFPFMPTPYPVTYDKVTVDYSVVIDQLMVRLAEFYQLPKEAQGLLLSLLREPKDKDLLAVFADWLEENNKPSDKIREVSK